MYVYVYIYIDMYNCIYTPNLYDMLCIMYICILFKPSNPCVDAEVNREELTTEVNNDIAPGREFEALGCWEVNQ